MSEAMIAIFDINPNWYLLRFTLTSTIRDELIHFNSELGQENPPFNLLQGQLEYGGPAELVRDRLPAGNR